MGKIKDFEEAARVELEQEDEAMVRVEIKERLREIRDAEIVLGKLKKRYTDFLEGDTDDLLL